jgi:hypothetical protein
MLSIPVALVYGSFGDLLQVYELRTSFLQVRYHNLLSPGISALPPETSGPWRAGRLL